MILIRFLPREPVFTSEELLRFANISDNAGQVFLGVMVLTPLISGFDKGIWPMVLSGTILTLTSWGLSWGLTRKAVRL
jgi:hypothetical protein